MTRIPVLVFVLAVLVQLVPLACYRDAPPCQGEPYPNPCDGRIDKVVPKKDAGR